MHAARRSARRHNDKGRMNRSVLNLHDAAVNVQRGRVLGKDASGLPCHPEQLRQIERRRKRQLPSQERAPGYRKGTSASVGGSLQRNVQRLHGGDQPVQRRQIPLQKCVHIQRCGTCL